MSPLLPMTACKNYCSIKISIFSIVMQLLSTVWDTDDTQRAHIDMAIFEMILQSFLTTSVRIQSVASRSVRLMLIKCNMSIQLSGGKKDSSRQSLIT